MAGQDQPARGRGVESGDDVGERDFAPRGWRPKGISVYVPASRQRGECGGDVLKQSRAGGLEKKTSGTVSSDMSYQDSY